MSLANTLSVLLNFKTDMSGLTKFTDGLRTRLQQVQELNQKLTNGAAAVNNALQLAAGYFAVGALKGYTAEAIQARTAQAKLDQALKQTKQSSAAYRSELGSQASALQQVTGMEDEVISGVQRQLIFAGAQKKDIAQLTALTLDFAAAKEIDAISASKAVGRALQGEGDELKRYGVEVNLAGDKTASLLAGLGKYKGQAAEAFAALPAGMRAFKVASKDAQQAAGEAVLEISSPFLQGLAGGLKTVTERFTKMREEGSLLQDSLRGVATWLGNVVGGNVDRLLMLAAAMLVLKGGGYAVNEAIKMLASSFLLVTGQSLPAMLAGLQSLSKEVGILQALSVGGWAARLAVALTGIAVGMAAFAVGSAVIGGIEQAQLSRLAREDQVRGKLAEQTRELTKQLAAIRSITDARNASATIEEQLKKYVAERDKLEGKKKIASTQSLFQGRRTFTDDDRERLTQLDQQIYDLAQRFRVANDKAWIERQINKNVGTETKARAALTPDQQAKAEDLDHKRAALELETGITEAQIEGNFELENRLTRERDELQLMQALKDANPDATAYNTGVDAIRARLDVEEELRRKAHDKELLERELFVLETQAKKAESAGNTKLAEQLREQATLKQLNAQFDGRASADVQARVDAERLLTAEKKRQVELDAELSRRIGATQAALAQLEASPFLTDAQKRDDRIAALQAINLGLEQRIKDKEKDKLNAAPGDVAGIQSNIDQYRAQQTANAGQIAADTSLTPQQGLLAGLVDYLNQVPSLANRARQAVMSIATALQTGIASSLEGLIRRTMTWRDALVNIGQTVVSAIISSFVNMAAQWIVQQIVMAVAGKAIAAAAIAAEAPLAIATAAMWAPAATLATIATLGGAAAQAPLTIALAKMSVLASSLSGFATGGIVTGGEQIIRVNEQGTEAVLNAGATSMVGHDFINQLNAGVLDLQALPTSMTRTDYGTGAGVTQTSAGSASSGGASAGGAMDLHAALRDFAGRITLVQVGDEREAQRIARRGRAAGDVVHIVRSNWAAITKRGPAD